MLNKKLIKVISGMSICFSLMSTTAFAGEWTQTNSNWRYIKDDGNYAVGWQYIDGEWYHFYGKDMSVGKLISYFDKTTCKDIKYLIGLDGKMKKAGVYPDSNGWYHYVDKDGIIQSGVISVNGKIYFSFGPNGLIGSNVPQQNGPWVRDPHDINSIVFYATDATGAAINTGNLIPQKEFDSSGNLIKINSVNYKSNVSM